MFCVLYDTQNNCNIFLLFLCVQNTVDHWCLVKPKMNWEKLRNIGIEFQANPSLQDKCYVKRLKHILLKTEDVNVI